MVFKQWVLSNEKHSSPNTNNGSIVAMAMGLAEWKKNYNS